MSQSRPQPVADLQKAPTLDFRKVNNLTGLVVFIIATFTFTATVEPTASFWDCGEFIAASYKLQVPHPPGAPFFLLLGRMFSFLSFGDVTKVAFWINMLSVFASAFTILFTFWIITLLGRKALNIKGDQLTTSQTILLMGAGVVGALSCAFADSFWFSAVEAEVYAMSSFFTSFVVWAMFKWERMEDESAANRWLIFIAYVIGLSIGVHLLNLVTLPALALVYYFKKYKPTFWGGVAAMAIGGFILILINNIIIPGLPSMAGMLEIFFVNSIGLPFGSGIIIFLLLFLTAVIFGVRFSIKKQNPLLNTVMLSLTFILIGYCCYAMVLVRANYNPPINENNPKDIISFVYYLKREQYGDRPLLTGYDFTTDVVGYAKGEPLYRRGKDRYEIYDYKSSPEYDPQARKMLLPRLHSRQDNHAELYRQMLNIPEGKKPTLADNFEFMFTHQLGHMYWRYFMWNFAGRASDMEGAGWLKPFDSTKGLPALLANNHGRNQFFMLPFILGLLGLFFHYSKDRGDFLVVILLFFLTGMALVLYLNSPPVEPRERDYIYVGSYWAFAIWIGMGVLALAEMLTKVIRNDRVRPAVATLIGLLIPGIMVAQGWDDHNRSNRYYSVDSAKNLLNSCAPNAILFTGGDNDTFPLWYVQEVEGFRTDVRVCNLSLLGTDWYIDQMKRKVYESEALPISLDFNQYISGKNDQIPYVERMKEPIDLGEYIRLVKEDSPIIKVPLQSGESINSLPSSILALSIDSAAVVKMGFVPKDLQGLVGKQMVWTLSKANLFKPDLVILDMLVTNQWKRPIYFSSTLSPSSYLSLREFMQVEGLAYRLLPVKVPGASQSFVNSDIMYENMMKKMYWREVDNTNVYYDENYRQRSFVNVRLSFSRLAEQLINEGKKDKAKKVLLYSLKVIPDKTVPYDEVSASFIQPLLQVGETQKALQIADIMAKRADENLNYYLNGKTTDKREVQGNLYVLNQIVTSLKAENQEAASKKYEAIFMKQYSKVQ
ncbi:MAG: DUF2723 domain-containing protein [Bacteroidota bacterium]